MRPAAVADLCTYLRALNKRRRQRRQQLLQQQSRQSQPRSRRRRQPHHWTRTQQKLEDVIHASEFRVEVCSAHVEKLLGLSSHVRRVWYINSASTEDQVPRAAVVCVRNNGDGLFYWPSVQPTANSRFIVSAASGASTPHSIRHYCDIKKERHTAFAASLDFANNPVTYNRFKFAVRVIWNKHRIASRCNECIKAFVWRTYRRGYAEYIGDKLAKVAAPPVDPENEATVEAWNRFFRHL